MSLRRVRSPDAPKITTTHASPLRSSMRPLRRGFCAFATVPSEAPVATRQAFFTAWPPNSLRSAASTRMANELS